MYKFFSGGFWALIVVFLGVGTNQQVQAQSSLTLVGHLPYTAQLSNLWGYVDPDSGIEYAIVGVYNGTSIVSLQNPAAPVEVAFVPGPEGIWREMKTWGQYAYVTNETGSGLQIIDLSNLPQTVNAWFWTGVDDPNYEVNISTIHTISTDEKGYAYLWGSNEDAVIIDLNANPINPPIVGIYDYQYVHDGFVRNDTMWTAEIYDGVISVVNVADRANPVVMASFATPSNFSHNCALSDDGRTLFTTDEVTAAWIATYDVADLTDVKEIHRVRTTPNTGSIPHNVYTVGNFLVTAYYRDGVTIHDATNPNGVILVANYDTAPTLSGDGFNGCWGVYPYFPSGLIIASDMEEGLYILQPDYVQACYLSGSVTNTETGAGIPNATVSIAEVPSSVANTGFSGAFQTGVAAPGAYTVTISAPGYLPATYTVTLATAETIILNASLTPLPIFNFNGLVINAQSGLPVTNANVTIVNPDISFNTTTNASGQFSFPNIFAGDYNIIAGKWGFVTQQTGSLFLNPDTGDWVMLLEPGYYDDFVFDFGWTVDGNAANGAWERGIPNGTTYNGQPMNPGADVADDIGDYCYVTGNQPNASAGDDDVDDGNTRLISPVFDLSTYFDPQLSYYRWFANAGGFSAPNDKLTISITNGANTAVIEEITATANSWVQTTINIKNYLEPTATMQLIFETADAANSGHLVEAATDWFRVIDLGFPVAAPYMDTHQPTVSLQPNPFRGQTTLAFNGFDSQQLTGAKLLLTDVVGKTVAAYALPPTATATFTLQQGNLAPGLYFYALEQNGNKLATGKMVIAE